MSEAKIAGVLISPIMFYVMAAIPIFLILRGILSQIGLLRWFWHPALVEVCIFAIIVAFLVSRL